MHVCLLFDLIIMLYMYVFVQSAILLDDKTCRAHELYHLFSQYPENLVNSVFTSMKNDRIVTKIKKVLYAIKPIIRGPSYMSS